MSCNPIVDLQDVNLSFMRRGIFNRPRFHALKDISFSVRKGETLGVIGRNGCGKSTLLRVLAGVYEPDSGTINRNGANISLLSLSVGFDQNLSGRDNAIISGMLLGHSRRDVLSSMDAIIGFSELEQFIDEPVRTYSSGMRARLGFSVAISMQADLVLIDEVLGVGDSTFREKAIAAMREKIIGDQGVVFVSHTERQIELLCDRVLWLEKGRVMALGNTKQVLDEYKKFVGDNKDLVV